MSDYKLVPVEPTQEMVEAARQHHEREAYLPVSLYKAMLAAAPDVQGEQPVAYLRKDQLRQVQRIGAMLGEVADSPRVDRVPVYTAPQPAPDVSALVESLELFVSNPTPTSEDFDMARTALAAHRKQGGRP